MLARNREALSLFAKLASKETYSDPAHRDPAKVTQDTPPPRLGAVAHAARLTSLRAAQLLEEGRTDEALDEALRLVDAAAVLLRARQPLVVAVTGMLLSEIAARRVRAMVASGRLSAAQLSRAAKKLAAGLSAERALESALRFELFLQLRAVGEVQPQPSFDPRSTMDLFAGRMRRIMAEGRKPCLEIKPLSQEKLPAGPGPNKAGRDLFNIPIPNYETLFTRRCETQYVLAAATAEAAVASFRRSRGRLPRALDELKPKVLLLVPIDPFNNREIRYDPATGAVRAAGKGIDGKTL